MARIVVLDSTPLGLLARPAGTTPLVDRCRRWADDLLESGATIIIPGIADYEVRRGILRDLKRKPRQARARLDALNRLRDEMAILPVDQDALDMAAALWAEARNRGRPTASDDDLDGDVILAALARLYFDPADFVVATSNPRHLSHFVPAMEWEQII